MSLDHADTLAELLKLEPLEPLRLMRPARWQDRAPLVPCPVTGELVRPEVDDE